MKHTEHWNRKAARHDSKQSGQIVIPQALPDRGKIARILVREALETKGDLEGIAQIVVIGGAGGHSVRHVAITRAELDAALITLRNQLRPKN